MAIPESELGMIKYDPDTGNFSWAYWRFGLTNKTECGNINANGYKCLCINRKKYYAHRVAWEIVHGEIPDGLDIDHKNGIRSDNRIANLRLATRSQNLSNAGRRSDNSSGYKGVSRTATGRWRATIQWHGKRKHIGSFDTAEAAFEAYAHEAERQRGEFARVH